jgi:hypothetical protein
MMICDLLGPGVLDFLCSVDSTLDAVKCVLSNSKPLYLFLSLLYVCTKWPLLLASLPKFLNVFLDSQPKALGYIIG